MAKIKISELASELGCEAKELIAFLQENGIEAKRSNSSIEEADAEVAKKHFGKGAKKAETKAEEPKKEEKKAKEPVKAEEKAPEAKEAPAAPKKPVEAKPAEAKPAEARPADAKPVKKPAEGAEAPKKKKKIIVVSNMNNSKMGGGNNQGGNNGGYNGQRRDNRDNRNGGQAPRKTFAQSQNVYHPIKPLTAPSQLDSYNTPVNKSVTPAKPAPKKVEEQPAAVQQPQVKTPAPEAPKATITNVEWAQALEMQKNGAVLIDVRTPAEVAEGTAPGSINIPLQEAEQRIGEFPKDKDLLIFCRSGKRSMAVSNFLIQNGYERVFNVVGGFLAFPKQ